jgi:hypothetical protein
MAPQPRVDHRVGDALVALGFGLLSAFLIVGVVDDGPGRARAGTLAALHIAPLALRRRWPAPVLGAMAASALLTIPLGVPLVVLGPAVLVAVYTIGATLEPPRFEAGARRDPGGHGRRGGWQRHGRGDGGR